ncbi:MAG: dCTP deaminase [Promethearchaeota archaeon]
MVWTGEKVSRYCEKYKKINPNGIDLVPIGIYEIPRETIYIKGNERGYLVKGGFKDGNGLKTRIFPDDDGFYNLDAGHLYEARFPRITIPPEVTGLAFPRSTLVRLGIIKVPSAVWDSGYSGEGTQTFHVIQPAKIHEDEAWIQMVFFQNESVPPVLYDGFYQEERAPSGKREP